MSVPPSGARYDRMSKKPSDNGLMKNAFRSRRSAVGVFVRSVLRCLGIVSGMLVTGCGQVMIRQDPCRNVSMLGVDHEMEGEMVAPCHRTPVADRLSIMKAKLGWQGEKIKAGVGRCSGKVSECWYSSRIAQWAAKHREAANAPPLPKFHPIPTHPALFPELDE